MEKNQFCLFDKLYDLDVVDYMAHVKINSRDLGVVWAVS